MRFKLDENFGPSIYELFARRGHDCRTVSEEGLRGASDDVVLEASVREERILVTMDHDFGDVLAYPPERTSGIAVIHPPRRATRRIMQSLVEVLLTGLEQDAIRGKPWIVEPARIREHEPEEPPEPD